MDGGYHAGRSLSCRAESTGQADQSKGRMEQSERGSGFSQYHGCPPHTHSRCNSGDLGVHPGRGPCGACVLTCRDQQALKQATRLISSLGYPVFRPPSKACRREPIKTSRRAGRSVSSRHQPTTHPPPLETSPPASASEAPASAPLVGFIGSQVPRNGRSSRLSAPGTPRPRRAYRARI